MTIQLKKCLYCDKTIEIKNRTESAYKKIKYHNECRVPAMKKNKRGFFNEESQPVARRKFPKFMFEKL